MASPFPDLRALEGLARAKLPAAAFDYVAGGAGDEGTLRANEAAFRRRALVPRVLRGVAERTTATTVLGAAVASPVLVAPTAFHQLAHPEGEAATARGAASAGTVMVASTLSNLPLEAIAAAAPGPKWFQLYVLRDRELTLGLVRRARAAGYRALVLTVDAPVLGRRERDRRNGFTLPPGLGLGNFEAARAALPAPGPGGSGLAAFVAQQLDPGLTWEDVAWLRREAGLPVVVKGVLAPGDAALAVEHGAAGIVVSNHGGRQLDPCIASLDALPAVVEAVGGRAEVVLDGGVRRGTDVLQALALGARAVLVGRPVVWGLALGGAEGVAGVLDALRGELDEAMALCGLRSPSEAGPWLLAPR